MLLGALFSLVACGEASKNVVVKEEVKVVNGDTTITRTTETVDANEVKGDAVEKEVKVRIVGPDEFEEIASTENGKIIDVRTAGEFSEGSIPGAENIDISNGDFQKAVETMDKTTPVLVYCKSGGRSARASKMLEEAGYENIVELEGGYMNYMLVQDAKSKQ